jgi:release factor glutamine methyltransferase
MTAQWTVGTVLTAAHQYLAERQFPAARLEAELLLAHSLKMSRFDLYMQYDRPLNESERGSFRELLKQRSSGRPIQHITGMQAFRHLNLKMTPGVFIPRPETELLVESVLAWLHKNIRGSVLEIGAGSGAVCISLAVEAPHTEVWAVDISEPALALARANAEAHDVADRIVFLHGDLFAAVPPGRRFSALVANPPYIPTDEIDKLSTEVRDHEPRAALDGGRSGLDFYQRAISGAPAVLGEGGLIAFEVGQGQADSVAAMLRSGGFGNIRISQDYAGIDRIVTGCSGAVVGGAAGGSLGTCAK